MIAAILPESARRSLDLPGISMTWSGPYANEFAGTGVSVVMLVGEKP
jgi:hypothetical protein